MAKRGQSKLTKPKGELKRILAKAIDSLSREERLVLSLYYFEELSVKEISGILRVSLSEVSQLHTKAMRKLRLKLIDHRPSQVGGQD